MPKVRSFTLENFKGSQKLTLKLDDKTRSQVVTLIGLNESGKTTILEGISHFPTNDSVVSSIFKKDDENDHALSIVPIHRKANFTGQVRIEGAIDLDDSDREAIAVVVKELGYSIDPDCKLERLTVTKSFTFKNGDFVSTSNIWDGIELSLRKGRKGKFTKYKRPTEAEKKAGDKDVWLEVVNNLEDRMPNIVYFPNFLVDVPKRIYLSWHKDETESNRYYRKIVQNVLSNLNEGLSLHTHVVDRVKKFKETGGASWIASLLSNVEKGKIDPIFTKLSLAVTKEVLGSWGRVFNRPVSAKRIEFSWAVDPDNDLPYAEVKVSDGESSYYLHERSLGFRWFFSFLLFTRFGGTRGRPNLFLFDEPAANLHARAQAELLGSFDKLVEAGDSVIYSTHSHHMIKPEWLSGAYIVENEAIDYDSESGGFDYDVKNTSVKITSYRQFVGTHGDRVSYFQPVLERLQYIEPSIASAGPQILLEGPSDFYALKYVLSRSKWAGKVLLVPGGGAGSLGPMISIALSRGYKFCILLDDDKAGQRARDNYRSQWALGHDEVATLGDVLPSLKDKTLEGCLSPYTLQLVRDRFGNGKKQSIANYLAEIAATMPEQGLGYETDNTLNAILDEICARLA